MSSTPVRVVQDTPGSLDAGIAHVVVIATAATAADVSLWAIRNSGTGKTLNITKIWLQMDRLYDAQLILEHLDAKDVWFTIRTSKSRRLYRPNTHQRKYSSDLLAKQRVLGLHSIEVKDNGRGFKVESVGPGSHGLAGIRHRVEAGGGRLTVARRQGEGTRIAAVLPKAL